ncbi:hypothetical protein PDESU_01833 [Pontiella desulfatans]|uniref:Glycoside hydrolase family 2 n=1 Tax=Pontiella desulfatans TaxID=2750659 RepID=A0A6C2U076_PONDE|nr:glycosyl hydrolase [Pontiella desulfatans]VGO13277.1 hypothetical protein PDESU_01833 [Pontiella desulfatans]
MTKYICMVLAFLLSNVNAQTLDQSFRNPPESTKPWCYWYWIDGDVTKEGITKDLEAMAEVGISRVMIGNVTLNKKTGPLKMLSPDWMETTRHAFSEAKRVGVDLYMFNGPGWSQSGGPWIKPEQSMRRVTWHELVAKGGAFSKNIRPKGMDAGQDIAVLAMPNLDGVSLEGEMLEGKLFFTHHEPFTARALRVNGDLQGKLFALIDGERKWIADIHAEKGNSKTDFLADADQTFSFADTAARTFEFILQKSPKKKTKKKGSGAGPAKVVLTSVPTVAQVANKQMGRMHPTPAPTWESYVFTDTVEPSDQSVLVQQCQIINLTDQLQEDGMLSCKLPAGNWNIIYFGMETTGKQNHPAPPEATGLEVDKMNKAHVRHHFNGMFSELIKNMGPEEKAAFKGITIDSYEVGAQNWTDGFAAEFEKRNGYDPIKLLPVMTGAVIDSAALSDRFLWDLRRTVADMIAENYVGELRDCAHEHGLALWCENYGHWGFPAEFLLYGGHADEVGGEFWVTPKDRGTIECRAASSAAHIYGKRRVYAEAFTNRLMPDPPFSFKARGEELFCEGINHFVLHVYVHQPRDGEPGKNPWFGTPFHRNTPWFKDSKDWITYLRRCHYMLQQGDPAADVAVYIGDFAPQMTGPANPVPGGYDYDYINSDVILRRLQVVDGEWVVFDEDDPKRIAARYRVLAMPTVKHIRPQVLARLEELRRAGGRTVDSVPVSASMLEDAGVAPMVSNASFPLRWTARRLEDGMVFFLSNFGETGRCEVTLRASGERVELFNPVTGAISTPQRVSKESGGIRVGFDVGKKDDSCFVVVRGK